MDSSTHADPIHEPPAEDSIRAGHEVRDVNIRVLLWLGFLVQRITTIARIGTPIFHHVAALHADPRRRAHSVSA